jgi:hypothetical protein
VAELQKKRWAFDWTLSTQVLTVLTMDEFNKNKRILIDISEACNLKLKEN